MSVITERFEEKCRECSEKTAVITVQDGKKFCRTFGQLYEDIKRFSGYSEKRKTSAKRTQTGHITSAPGQIL